MNFLNTIDAQRRRESRVGNVNPFAPTSNAGPNGITTPTTDPRSAPPIEDEEEGPASPLQAASKLLNEVNADHMLNTRNLEQMNEQHLRHNAALTTPPPDPTSRKNTKAANRNQVPHSATSSASMSQHELDNMVYPIGHTEGIDPMYSEHINNIPYSLPPKAPDGVVAAPPKGRQKSTIVDPGWIRQPQILLVEDDPTCRRIGGKFLYAFHCSIDSAVSASCLLR